MTREEAIEKLELMRQKVDEETYRALVLAIKALSQEPTFDDECQKDMDEAWEQIQKKRKRIPVTLDLTPCEDAVRREAVLDALFDYWHKKRQVGCSGLDIYNESAEILKQLPSVTQKSGKWIHFAQSDDCSECGWSTGKYISPSKYCPNCGAKMESEE